MKILSGVDEGAFAWLTLNYLLGRLGGSEQDTGALGLQAGQGCAGGAGVIRSGTGLKPCCRLQAATEPAGCVLCSWAVKGTSWWSWPPQACCRPPRLTCPFI